MSTPLEECPTVTAADYVSTITVPSNSVYVVVNLGYNPHLYGMKATVTGVIDREVAAMPWLVDVHRCLGLVGGRLSSLLLRGDAGALAIPCHSCEFHATSHVVMCGYRCECCFVASVCTHGRSVVQKAGRCYISCPRAMCVVFIIAR